MKDPKTTNVDLNSITIDMSRNIREADLANYDLKPLIDDLAYRGQLTDVELEKVVEPDPADPSKSVTKLYPLRGYRRLLSIKHLQENNDPATGQPYINQATGRPWKDEKVKAKVFENLSEPERIMRMWDHGQTKNLSKLETNRAIWRSYDAQLGDKEIVKMGRGLLEYHYPPRRTVEDTDEARLAYWKGALQMIKWAWESPYVLREVVEEKLRGHTNWPLKNELKELRDIFVKEVKDDATNTYSRANPGPKFMARFNEMKAEKAIDAGEGADDGENGNRSKSKAMKNRTQVDELHQATDSRILKTAIDVIRNKIPNERYGTLDKLCVELEKSMTQEQKNILSVVIGVDSPAETEETEETVEQK